MKPLVKVAVWIFFGGFAVLAFDSCRSNANYNAAEEAKVLATNKAIGEKNLVEFLKRAPDQKLMVDVSIDPQNPNTLFVNLEKTWDGLLIKEQNLEMEIWVRIWRSIVEKQRAGDGSADIAFFKPTGGLPEVFTEK